jgi:uncharacterized protein
MFRPSLAYKVLNEPYLLWCDYHAPRDEAVDEATSYDRLRLQWGLESEAAWVKGHYPVLRDIRPLKGREALEATLRAMLEGVPAIYQPSLWDLKQEMYGSGDVLVRDDSAPSDLGPYHYRVQEIKRTRNVQPYHGIQAGLYNRILGVLQGYCPTSFDIVLPSGSVTKASSEYDGPCDEVLSAWRRIRDDVLRPEPPGFDDAGSPWRVWTNKVLEQARDLTLLPPISSAAKKKLTRAFGVLKTEELHKLSQEDFQKALGPIVGLQCFSKLKALRLARPVLGHGVVPAIPRRQHHIYFDFETCDHAHPRVPPHAYMIGAYDSERDEYRAFVARGPEEEPKIFAEFLAWVGDLDPTCLYHWTSYETETMKSLAERHPKLRDRLAKVILSCVDLKECLAKKVFFGTRTYSIKQVAPFLGFHWRQKDVGAYESMVLYWEWLEDQIPEKIERVIRYNEDDCMAMVHVDKAIASFLSTPTCPATPEGQ